MSEALILIIEDNEKNRKLLRDVLEVKGYRTLESETGEEGLRLAQQQRPDLVIMDVRLPGISGLDVFQQLRADTATCTIPVIAVTASAMHEEQQQIRAAGFDGYESKPIKVMEFLDKVKDILERQS